MKTLTKAMGASGAAIALGLVVSIVPWLNGCQGGRGARVPSDMQMQQVGPYRVAVSNAPDPPRMGDDALTVVIRDAGNKPVRGADVSVVVSMPAMGAMPYMESRGKVKESKPGVYRAEYGLSMNGEWDVNIRIRPKTGPPAEAAYRLSTSLKGLSFAGGTPAAGAAAGAGAGAAGGHAGHAAGGTASPAPEGEVPGAVALDPARRQALGIRTAKVEMRHLGIPIRTVGQVAYDESRQSEVSLKFSGWVRDIMVDYTGRAVREGEVLFTAYSPELWSAQQEYLESLYHGQPDTASAVSAQRNTPLAGAARLRLQLWDIPAGEIERLERERKPREAVPIVAPSSGVVTDKTIVRGSPFTAGQVLYKIAPLDPAWVIASVFQMDLALVRVGMPATLLDPYLDTRSRTGRVSFIYPSLEGETRTGRVRIEVANPRGDLKPGTFVGVELEISLGRKLAVPQSAVIPTGERRVVFVDLGNGRLAPRDVRLGHRAGDYYEVLAGLNAGDVVVTSGNFLVAAESRLKSAAQKW
jgi:Cu(I)/Ag(I) efflux system membrane fusion protein